MNALSYFGLNILAALLRFFPMRCPTGLVKTGNPDRQSPVFLTGNYRLTAARVKQTLRGVDGWLLVADSRGINVWCAAAGGHLNNHSVISVIKTSGIGERVDHRTIILPQLAAVGVEAKEIKAKTGWSVKWGPVYAKNIPAFLERGIKTEAMKMVKFPWKDRLEMAVAWALPLSLLLCLPVFLIKKSLAAPLAAVIWIFSAAFYLLLPLYKRLLKVSGGLRAFALQYAFPLIIWIIFMAVLSLIGSAAGTIQMPGLMRWAVLSLAVVLFLGIEIRGTTPLFKGSFMEGQILHLDENLCRGAGFCAEVCPMVRFSLKDGIRKASLTEIDSCVNCGACVVQCPFDALYFVDRKGEKIPPADIRTYKINMMGKRTGH